MVCVCVTAEAHVVLSVCLYTHTCMCSAGDDVETHSHPAGVKVLVPVETEGDKLFVSLMGCVCRLQLSCLAWVVMRRVKTSVFLLCVLLLGHMLPSVCPC